LGVSSLPTRDLVLLGRVEAVVKRPSIAMKAGKGTMIQRTGALKRWFLGSVGENPIWQSKMAMEDQF